MWIGTFHGLSHRLLRLHWQVAKLPEGFQVLDSDDQLRLVKRVVEQLELDEARFPPRQIAWWINAQKDEGRRPQHIQADRDEWSDEMLKSYALYQERCDRAGLSDFAAIERQSVAEGQSVSGRVDLDGTHTSTQQKQNLS